MRPGLFPNDSLNHSISTGGVVQTASPVAIRPGIRIQATRGISAHTAERWRTTGVCVCLLL